MTAPLADAMKTDARLPALSRFAEAVFDEDEMPIFVSDEACLYDLSLEEEPVLQDRIQRAFGVTITLEQFRWPMWKLLDLLCEKGTLSNAPTGEVPERS